MIISDSYFLNNPELEIANLQDIGPNSNLLGSKAELDKLIKIYESDILTKCLGYSLYALLEAERDENESNGLKVTAAEKWNELLNGKEYTLDDKPIKWPGIVFLDVDIPRSFIAEYVFHHFLKKNRKSRSSVGMVREKAKGAVIVDDSQEYVDSYNRFYDLAVGNSKSIEDNAGIRSLYQFINDMNCIDPTTYPNWMPFTFPKLNIMGI